MSAALDQCHLQWSDRKPTHVISMPSQHPNNWGMHSGNRSTIKIHVKLFLPQTAKHQSSWKHLQLDTLQLPTKTQSMQCLLNNKKMIKKKTRSLEKLLTQNSKLKKSCDDNKWCRKPCKRERISSKIFTFTNIVLMYSLTFVAKDASRKLP